MALREGGWPKRWHIERCHTSDSIAQHSHQMLVLGYALFADQMTPNLVKAITFHDLHERWVGDWPYGAKGPLSGGEARAMEHKLATKFRTALGIVVNLNDDEAALLTYLDTLDATLFAREEVLMGNKLMEGVFEECLTVLQKNSLFDMTVAVMMDTPVSDRLDWLKELER